MPNFTQGSTNQDQTNKATIRIWTRETKVVAVSLPTDPHGANKYGHVSLQTYAKGTGFYVSIFPNKSDKRSLGIYEGKINNTYEDDRIAEGGKEPDLVIDLYTLNVPAMEQLYYSKFKDKIKMWGITGSSVFNHDPTLNNCAGMVMELLEAGGINNLIPQYKNLYATLGYATAGALSGAAIGAIVNKKVLLFSVLGMLISIVANQTDVIDGNSIAFTPDGVGALALQAQRNERAYFNANVPNAQNAQTTTREAAPYIADQSNTQMSGALASVGMSLGALFGSKLGQNVRNNGGSSLAPVICTGVGAAAGGILCAVIGEVVNDSPKPRPS